MELNLVVNFKNVKLNVKEDERLLDILREKLNLTGAKEGCSMGECGACSIILNGKLTNSCLVIASQLKDGDEIITVEGITETKEKVIQDSFVEKGAVQCGYCTPGMVVASYELLKRNKKPTEDEIRKGLSGNLCRCTGYKKIVEAVKDASEKLSE